MERHSTPIGLKSDDIGHPLLIGVQMLAIAINVHHGMGETSARFALASAAGTVLVVEYFRVAKHIPLASELATRYGMGFAIAASLWLVSAFVPSL